LVHHYGSNAFARVAAVRGGDPSGGRGVWIGARHGVVLFMVVTQTTWRPSDLAHVHAIPRCTDPMLDAFEELVGSAPQRLGLFEELCKVALWRGAERALLHPDAPGAPWCVDVMMGRVTPHVVELVTTDAHGARLLGKRGVIHDTRASIHAILPSRLPLSPYQHSLTLPKRGLALAPDALPALRRPRPWACAAGCALLVASPAVQAPLLARHPDPARGEVKLYEVSALCDHDHVLLQIEL
jgi:hypothetical protein